MALAKCSQCGGQVAVTATACPHCGHRSKAYNPGRDAALYLLTALIGLIVSLFTPFGWVIVGVAVVFGIGHVGGAIYEGPPKKK